MNKLLITGCLLATTIAAVAMPTKKDLAAAQKRIEDVIAPDVKALNARRKTVKDVADVQMKLASDAQSEAEKYLLLQSAFKLYSRGEEFDSAAKALTAITRDIKDVPPELIVELIDKEFHRGMGQKAPKEIVAAERAMQRQRLLAMQKRPRNARAGQRQMTVGGYTWSYNVKNGEATIVSWKNGKSDCAVSPKPTGDVTIPSTLDGATVTGVGQGALSFCPDLDSVAIPEGVKTVGTYAFGKCGELKSVSIPSSVTVIGNASFCYCSKLESVTIPKNVVSIWDFAFIGCSGLKSIEIPDYVRNIGKRAFYECTGLTSVTVRGERPDVKEEVFGGCTNLKFIHVPAKAKSWAGMKEWQGIPLVFDDDTDVVTQRQATVDGYTWSYCVTNGEVMIVSPTGKLYERAVSPCPTGDVVIPSWLDGKPVTGIGKFALCHCPGVTSVKIPESVKCIGEWAFSGCSTLTAVMLPLSLTNIKECVFADCPSLLTIGLDAGNPVYKVVDGVLYTKDMKRLVTGLGGLTSVAIPSGVVDIGDHAFRCCRKLKSVTIPMSVKCIGRDAFCATALKSIAIPSSVESIGDQAYWCCSGLNSVTMSEGVRSIGRMAFYQCGGLESVTIPASVKNIEYEAFFDCSKLTSVTMRGEKPDSGDKVFDKCDKLKSIHVPANAKSWAGMKEWQGIQLVFDAR